MTVVVVALSVAVAAAIALPSGPIEPIGAITDAFRTHALVALGEVHGNEQSHAFRMALVRDKRFASVANDIVVEFGNAKFQDIVDRFVAGGDVADAELRQVWQDTTQTSGVWDRPIYGDFIRAVRDVNRSLDGSRKLRLLLADPPVDWDLVRRSNEGPQHERDGKVQINGIWVDKAQASTLDRDGYAAGVIQREVLAKGRRALLVFGDMHVRRLGRSVVTRLENSTAAKVFTIVNAIGVRYDDLRTAYADS